MLSLNRLFKVSAVVILLAAHTVLYAQSVSFEVTNSIVVRDSSGKELPLAATGGLNQPQFYNLDINNDGNDDLFVFDRNGNKTLSLIYDATHGYSYQPEFDQIYPKEFSDWVVFKDFNDDGLADLWFYDVEERGVALYKNVTIASDEHARFEVVSPKLKAYNFSSPPLDSNSMYADIINIPTIEDVDGDGDIDFMTLQNPGYGVTLFLNTSAETGKPLDEPAFDIADVCWGDFTESLTDNRIKFERNPFCLGKNYQHLKKKHEGGTSLLLLDDDGDGDMDLLMGNAGLNNLNFLENGKTDFSLKLDSIISNDSTYPANTLPVNVNTFAAPYYQDVTGDGINDLLVAVNYFDKSQKYFRETNNVLFYENIGQNNNPTFQFVDSSFLVNDMVDHGGYASPVLFDVDGDEDFDLIICTNGDWGLTHDSSDYLVLYRNIGTKSDPEFQLEKRDYLGLKQFGLMHLSPSLYDFDTDGTPELVVGQADGSLSLFGLNGLGVNSQASLITHNLNGIDVGENSSPFVADIDEDSLGDVLVGSDVGRIYYYKNSSSTVTPNLSLESDSFGGVVAGQFRKSQWYDAIKDEFFDTLLFEPVLGVAPQWIDVDENGSKELILGDLAGHVTVYSDHQGSGFAGLTRAHDVFRTASLASCYTYHFGENARPALADLNNDGEMDMVVGTNRGGVQFALGTGSCNLDVASQSKMTVPLVYPNPTEGRLNFTNLQGNAEVLVYSLNGAKLFESHVEPAQEINLSHLPNGLYFVRLITNSGTYSRKVIKVD